VVQVGTTFQDAPTTEQIVAATVTGSGRFEVGKAVGEPRLLAVERRDRVRVAR
jgi:hypothetical protein